MDCPIISPEEFPFDYFDKVKPGKNKTGNPGNAWKRKYLNIVTAFDIETSRVPGMEQSAMYVWQWQWGLDFTVMGRTWDQFRELIGAIVDRMKSDHSLVILVHNLSYEFQFLRGIYQFSQDEVFALDRRKVLKATMYGRKLEFRCSYLHSNMNLGQYTKKMNVEHQKLSGEDFDYREIRYPWTPLTDQQKAYCQNDVLGLVEAYMAEMERDNDKISSIPATSTGYVRRDVKRAMKKASCWTVKNAQPDEHTYWLLKEAFRGGDTHANRFYAGHIVKDVKSADRSSSYPDTLCNCKFPMGRFQHLDDPDLNKVLELSRHGKAYVIRIAIWDIDLIDPYWGFPYLSRSKCRNVVEPVLDNGRIIKAAYLETTLTDVDLDIVLHQYDWDHCIVIDCDYTRYGYLPQPLVLTAIQYYRNKTELKGVGGPGSYEEALYGKSKALLNSIYGCMAQDQCKQTIIFNGMEFMEDTRLIADLLAKNSKNAYLCYAWGVWITAWARLRLQEGLRLAGHNALYCDTDSVKYIGDVDWTAYNDERIKASKKSGAYATDPKGVTHYMGVFEYEGQYDQFVTLGAKKYCYTEDGKSECHITCSGVGKKAGGLELDEAGGIEHFREGFIFSKAGGTESVYNDNPPERYIEIDGHTLEITPNIYIKDSTYTVGLTADYERLLENPFYFLDKIYPADIK